jgi:excisionase family DNA binding protein
MSNIPRTLTPAEVCAILKIDNRTLRAMADAGIFSVIKVGVTEKHRRYREDEIRRYVEGPGAQEDSEPEPRPGPPGPGDHPTGPRGN